MDIILNEVIIMKVLSIKMSEKSSGPVFEDSLFIRKKVFIDGQGIDPKIEVDDPVANTQYFVGYVKSSPVTTLRALNLTNKQVKLQRVATLTPHSGKGYSSELITYVSDYYRDLGFNKIILGAQVYIVPFYEKLGFKAYGDRYMEAGIEHQMMGKGL